MFYLIRIMEYQVLLAYKYVKITSPENVCTWVRDLCEKYSLLGRVIVAEEGINLTVEGRYKDIKEFSADILKDKRFSDMNIKKSAGTGLSFPKLSVKVRDEIVSTGLSVDPNKGGRYLDSSELYKWFREERDFVVVDMRNDYEVISGKFRNSLNLGLKASRDLVHKVDKLDKYKDKKVLTVCTGGVRCEKMSSYLVDRGFKKVYQLKNGIHTYMEKYPGKDFEGTLYTFDKRETMNFGGDRNIIGECMLCGRKTERYINCANLSCNIHFLACIECCGKDQREHCSNCKKNLCQIGK